MATSGGDENGKYCTPRVEIEPKSLAFWASALTITPHKLLDVTTLCGPLPERSVHFMFM